MKVASLGFRSLNLVRLGSERQSDAAGYVPVSPMACSGVGSGLALSVHRVSPKSEQALMLRQPDGFLDRLPKTQ